MPNPAVGSGAATSYGLQIFKYALYLGAFGGAAAVPTNKLGAGSEPASPWVRQGRLRDDAYTSNVGQPEVFKARAGWDKSIQWAAVQQAEEISFTVRLDERDPDVQAKLRGTVATSLSSGSNTGQQFIYKSGSQFSAKVLLVGVAADPSSARERHVYAGKCLVTFVPVKEADYEGLDVKIDVLDVSSSESYRDNEWA